MQVIAKNEQSQLSATLCTLSDKSTSNFHSGLMSVPGLKIINLFSCPMYNKPRFPSAAIRLELIGEFGNSSHICTTLACLNKKS